MATKIGTINPAAGATGPTGPTGATGSTGSTGATGPSSAAALQLWDSATAYAIGQVVLYSGTFYQALTASTAATPDVSPTDWSALGSLVPA